MLTRLCPIPQQNPADIVTKLKYLFIVVITLFGCMWLGAGVGYFQDARMRARIMHKLQEPRMGFYATEEGAWLWRFHLDPIEKDLAPPTGPAVELAKVFGLPLARLRAALPDELLEHTLAETLGRRYGLSASGMEESLDAQVELTLRLSSLLGRPSRKILKAHHENSVRNGQSVRNGHSAHNGSNGNTPVAAPKSEVRLSIVGKRHELELMVGTALVLAFIQVGQLMPVVELTRRISAAAARFEGLQTPAGWDFGKTQTDFVRAQMQHCAGWSHYTDAFVSCAGDATVAWRAEWALALAAARAFLEAGDVTIARGLVARFQHGCIRTGSAFAE